ncbi:hypothetical protein Glove_33g162 [Diversispora epigaea]|uniref:BTB domain-containing protein n=1 Tax=Diversispora epigaea TaxID=1348612 RepID=A0A397JT35_9GLOM|nr:hypothetical protein Glove_33g162 [Diversispora epigaea]
MNNSNIRNIGRSTTTTAAATIIILSITTAATLAITFGSLTPPLCPNLSANAFVDSITTALHHATNISQQSYNTTTINNNKNLPPQVIQPKQQQQQIVHSQQQQFVSHQLNKLLTTSCSIQLSQNLVELLEVENKKKSFIAHSNILKYRSSYFRQELETIQTNENNIKIITKPSISSKILVETRFIFDLMLIANEFELEELSNKLETILIEDEASHFSLVYRSIFVKENLNLENFCIDIVVKYPNLIFDSSDFTSLPESSHFSPYTRGTLHRNKSKAIYFPACKISGYFKKHSKFSKGYFGPKVTELPPRINELKGPFSTIISEDHAAEISSWIDLVVTKVKGTDEIIEGYNPLACDNTRNSVSVWMETKYNFIFSLKNGNIQNSILSKVLRTDSAVCKNDLFSEKSNFNLDYYEKRIKTSDRFSIDNYEEGNKANQNISAIDNATAAVVFATASNAVAAAKSTNTLLVNATVNVATRTAIHHATINTIMKNTLQQSNNSATIDNNKNLPPHVQIIFTKTTTTSYSAGTILTTTNSAQQVIQRQQVAEPDFNVKFNNN